MVTIDEKINSLLNKGIVDVIVREDLEKKLKSGKKLRIKLGIDPSGSDLHIGHMVVVKKLREFQDLGHHVLLLFGNFTGQIGDPTGKNQTRKIKTQEELEKNAQKYIDQVKVVLDVKNIEVCWNADWLATLNFSDVVTLASNFTVMQMMERDMFQDRLKKNLPISLHEFLYPLMQGYDSVALKADVELGGTDQTFNLLAGRTLQKAYGQEPQNILTMPILEGKSENNYIGVSDAPNEMYGKVMSIPDDLIVKYFELATNVSLDELNEIKNELKNGKNPRDLKMRLGRELVKIYHGENVVKIAEDNFINVFRNKDIPDDMPEIKIKKEKINIIDLLIEGNLVDSKSEARRLIDQNAVSINEVKKNDINEVIMLDKGMIIKVGKRKFGRIG